MYSQEELNKKTQILRADFPLLGRMVSGKPVVYLDNAATTQKPRQVIDALVDFYSTTNANVHRGTHHLSREATRLFEAARETVARFVNATLPSEIIFTRGTTESINLVASILTDTLHEGDEVVISALEHHSNIVPWQMACLHKSAVLKIIPLAADGMLDMEAYRKMLNPRTKMVAIGHISNALGTINPVREMISAAKAVGALTLVDGAQGIAHGPVDMKQLGCDFYAFSGHKMYGPMGIGVLYARQELFEKLPPYQFGGEMIEKVSFDKTTFNVPPYKYEAGTPNVADAVGLAVAIDYLEALGWGFVKEKEQSLLDYAMQQLSLIPGMKIFGSAANKSAIVSFHIEGTHFYDLGTLLDHMGIALRTGNHCAQPLMDVLGITGTLRASFVFYNTFAEIDLLAEALSKAKQMLA